MYEKIGDKFFWTLLHKESSRTKTLLVILQIDGFTNQPALLDALPVYDNRYYKKNKLRTYDDKIYTNLWGLNVPEDLIECKFVTVISIDSLLVYDNKYYLQVYLDNCTFKIVDKQKKDYVDDKMVYNSKECMIFHYWFLNHEFEY